jgi:XTP/dITP diphosphohydrolase
MKLIFATSNANKLIEIRSLLPVGIEVKGLKDIGFTEELPETRDTIEGNSLQKAEYLSNALNMPCFAEDTGLIIDALNGEPGVYSARYAGEKATYQDNVDKVLANMQGHTNRRARFKTVITYYNKGQYVQFEGITEGIITETPIGNNGFGYDPIFIPDGTGKTYAQMDLAEKNLYSHRKKSFEGFANHLNKMAVL